MKSQHQDDYTLLSLDGGWEETQTVSRQMEMVRKGEISKNIILDLSRLDFVQSYQIGMMIKIKSTTDELNGRFMIVGDSDEIKDILEVVDLGFMVPRFKSVEEALTSLNAKS